MTLPEALCTRDQWICWKRAERNGEKTKIPVDPQTAGFASTTDEGTWCDLETALECMESGSTAVDGLGFVFTKSDPFVGIDLDDCRDPDTGKPTEQAKTIVSRLDSYTEVSPSGTGYHVLIRGELPEGRNRRGHIEMYDHARYFTVTGKHVSGTPTQIESRQRELEGVHLEYVGKGDDDVREASGSKARLSDDELLEKARNAANGEKFERLWNGSTVGYTSQSEADMALCCLLAFWTGAHAGQMDRLFRRSKLDRPKWGEEHYADGSTYGEKTIARAIAHTSEFYEPSESGVETQEVGSSRDREHVYLKERVSLLRKQTTSLEREVEAKTARIERLERRLETYEGRSAAREEESESSREMQSKSLVRQLRGILGR
ncbi:hypothetical protein [Natrinema hispanicum]|uniref:NrS-1 polymerase-like HBD domain-containing protein n=1 Tax=Natrinema hispanicum TaxID=392421 RepID=A0A1I0IL19_9EURY|nr:hypothetical protein [Natrinema hispanicum]SET97764.1 hypothetical protein SAMN04488694_12226 [Natrinema hispanicum]